METNQAYYLLKMREALSLKQRANPHYSLRAFARDIGIHPATLSQIINGKRRLPLKDSDQVIRKLNLGPRERNLFLESLKRNKTTLNKIRILENDDRLILDESYYKIIAEWEHYAVLELFNLTDFNRSKDEISQRLGLNPNRTEVVVSNLLNCRLLELNPDGSLNKVHSDVTTADDLVNQALRDSHRESLLLGCQKLEEIALELRDFSSLTLAIDMEKVPEVKLLIREFRKKITSLLKEGHKYEVYQLAIQFYPLTNLSRQAKEVLQ
jgi:uncharacterized protein (TIGR02147 family)